MAEKKFEKLVSVASLGTPDKDGYLTKQGGSIKTWKRRKFYLKGNMLYYFKTPKDTEQTGEIKLSASTTAQEEPKKGKKYYFSITTTNRKYMIFAETEESMKQWVDAIHKAIEEVKNGGKSDSGGASSGGGAATSSSDASPAPAAEPAKTETPAAATETPAPAQSSPAPAKAGSPREQINVAKDVIPFLQDEDSKVLEFWQIWSESIPPQEDLGAGLAIDYHVSTSANMQKLTWRTAGPQNIFIQKMVDFFWNVGAPESEIDRLNDVGALINPVKIGSWIDMSAKGGMDGGWYFPVSIPLKLAIEAADPGDPARKVMEWAEANSVEQAWSVGRDMGAAPPRQTEIRIQLPGESRKAQVQLGLQAFDAFGFPPIKDDALAVLNDTSDTGPELCMSVITSSEGFVRLGLMTPKPAQAEVDRLCNIAEANIGELRDFEKALNVSGPAYAEYQFLKEGFGYGVYREGFDIVFHYDVGSEGPE